MFSYFWFPFYLDKWFKLDIWLTRRADNLSQGRIERKSQEIVNIFTKLASPQHPTGLWKRWDLIASVSWCVQLFKMLSLKVLAEKWPYHLNIRSLSVIYEHWQDNVLWQNSHFMIGLILEHDERENVLTQSVAWLLLASLFLIVCSNMTLFRMTLSLVGPVQS